MLPSLNLAFLAMRFRLLKHTRLNVVAFLNELPKTQHDIASFTVDVNTYTVRLCLFCKPALVISLFLSLWIISHVLILQKCFPFTEHTIIIHSERSLQRRWVVWSSWFSFVLIHCKDKWCRCCCWCVMFVFQLLLTVNPESPPWLSLEFSSQSQQGILGKFSELPMVCVIILFSFTFSLRRGHTTKLVTTVVDLLHYVIWYASWSSN